MTKPGERSEEDQVDHEWVIDRVAHKRYQPDEFTTYKNPDGPQKWTKSAGKVDGEDQYPDIVGVTKKGVVELIAEIETAEDLDDEEAQQWKRYTRLPTKPNFYLYVPKSEIDKVKKLMEKHNVTVKGLRGYEKTDNDIKIIEY